MLYRFSAAGANVGQVVPGSTERARPEDWTPPVFMIETEIDMASEALGSAYVLSEAGARQLAEMTVRGSAPVASPGFSSRLREFDSADSRLSALERLVRAHSSEH